MRHETSWTQVLCIKLIHYAKGLSSSCPSSSIVLPLLLSPFKQPHSFHRPRRRCTCLTALLLLCHILISPSLALLLVQQRHLTPLRLIIPHCLFFCYVIKQRQMSIFSKTHTPLLSELMGKRHPPLFCYLSRT